MTQRLTLDQVQKLYTDSSARRPAKWRSSAISTRPKYPKILGETFGGWKGKQSYARIPRMNFPDVPGGLQQILTPDKANAVYVAGMAFAMKDSDPDYPALVMGNYVLGGGTLSSRLGDRVRQKEGLSYGVRSYISADALDPRASLTISAICNPKNIEKVNTAISEELAKLLASGVTVPELDKAKQGYLQQQQVARTSDTALVGTLTDCLYDDRTMAYYGDLEKKVSALTPPQVLAALQKYIDPKRLVIVDAGDFGRQLGEQRLGGRNRRGPVVDHLPGEMLPIIEPGAAQIIVIEPKAERPDEPQLGPRGNARAAHAAGVVWNLGLIKHDVQQRLVGESRTYGSAMAQVLPVGRAERFQHTHADGAIDAPPCQRRPRAATAAGVILARWEPARFCESPCWAPTSRRRRSRVPFSLAASSNWPAPANSTRLTRPARPGLPTATVGRRNGSTWEALLDLELVDAVVVARGPDEDRRAEQLRKLIQTGVPLLVSHPVVDSMLIYYELDMIRRETGSVVIPDLLPAAPSGHRKPGRHDPRAPESPIGRVEQVLVQRCHRRTDEDGGRCAICPRRRSHSRHCRRHDAAGRHGRRRRRAGYGSLGVQMSGPRA